MNYKQTKWVLGTLLLSLAACSVLAACSDDKGGNATISPEDLTPFGKYEKEVVFTEGRAVFSADGLPKGDTLEDNPATRYLAEKTNIKKKIAWEAADFPNKFAMVLAAKELPDVMKVDPEQFQHLVDNDLVADLSDIYDKTVSPRIKEYYESYSTSRNIDVLNVGKRDGKLYGMPQPYGLYEETITWIRKDWLDKVGLSTPETIDDLEKVMKAFVDNKLGGDQTVGCVIRPEIAGGYGECHDASPIANQLGSYPKQWVDKDGEAVYGSVQPETKDVLELLARWYKEGIIDQEIGTRDWGGRNALLSNEQTGIYFAPWWASGDFEQTYQTNPNAEWIAIQGPVKNKGDKFQTIFSKPAVSLLVVRKGYAHPEAVIRALNNEEEYLWSFSKDVLDFNEKEKQRLGVDSVKVQWYQGPVCLNIEPARYRIDSSKEIKEALQNNDGSKLGPQLLEEYNHIKAWQEKKDINGLRDYLWDVQGVPNSTNEANMEVKNLPFYGKTATMLTKGANLDKMEQEVFLKIIIGEQPISAFDKFVKDWHAQGGDDITKEVREQVKKGIVE